MAWGAPCLLLPPVLLVFLASGSQGWMVVPELLHEVVGQTLSVRCQYPPEGGTYREKTWCRETSPNRCTRLVISSRPQTAAQASRYTIWDAPVAGFFVINMTQLREDDSGPYWCGIYSSSSNTVTILRNISLLVSPALATSPTWTPTWLLESTGLRVNPMLYSVLLVAIVFFMSFSVLTTSPEGTSGPPSLNGSEHRKSSSPLAPGCAAYNFRVTVLCGFLGVKGLMLSVLLVFLSYRRWAQGRGEDSKDGGF